MTPTVSEALSNASVTMEVHGSVLRLPTMNLIASSRHGDPNNVIVIGSHLDSVPAG